ncbi:DMT family transporter [Rubrobacter aplysinae]|uniref:DMT family transporter n=1 Tax=Rubrobacter aplysinae TaxID=909625 RepID=UPI00064BAD26|nr:DMT family transporter [Rubrobacter aplysinae]
MAVSPPQRPAYALLVVAAASLWGTTGTAQALAPAGANPVAVGAVRVLIGGAALVTFALLGGLLSRGGSPVKAGAAWAPGAVAAAALGVALYQPLFFAGVALSGVSVGTVVAIGSAPVMAGLVGFAALGERPGGLWAVATVLAVAGCGLLLGSGGPVEVSVTGVLCALGAGLCYGSYATASKVLLDRGVPQSSVMAAAFGLGGALLVPALFFVDLGWLVEPSGVAAALHLGLIATAVAYLLFARGLSGLPVATAATLSLAEPLTAGALGFLLLGERLPPVALVGATLLLGGLFAASREE